jgi:ribosomal protein S8
MEIVNVRLPDKLLTEVDTLSEKHNLSRSEILRQALTIYLHLMENAGTMLRPLNFQIKPSQITYTRRGDVSIMKVPTGHAVVVGSTSSGAVGPKLMDKVKVDGKILGKFWQELH